MNAFRIKFINKTIQGLLVFMFAMNVGVGLFAPFLALFVNKNIVGASLGVVGFLIAISAIVKSIIQLPIAKWLDSQAGEKSDYYMLLFGTSAMAVYLFGLVWAKSVASIALLQILCGAGEAMIFAAYYAVFAHHIDKDSEGFEWSLLSVIGLTISVAIGTFFGGIVAERYGFSMLFVSAGFLNLICIFLLLVLYPHMNVMRKHGHYKTIVHEDRKEKYK